MKNICKLHSDTDALSSLITILKKRINAINEICIALKNKVPLIGEYERIQSQ